ncbi:bifunctional serine/threonine-protein kinase/ABC transporter substrate-binding protein [Leptolyngbya sp. AN03gr2]|uniref:bifunctional serine/threonine-protein kinase/ABC transporter substrate-binding protein n=1 Tax=unclassified Leptolyngbya TaxID=2650499 RepID=UPI003D3140CE
MSFCINPRCNSENPDDADRCSLCQTALLIDGRFRLRRLMQRNDHTYTTVYEAENLTNPKTPLVLKALEQVQTEDQARKQDQRILTDAFEKEVALLADLMELENVGVPRYVTNFLLPLPRRANIPTSLRCLVMKKIEGENLQHWLDLGSRLTDEAIALKWLKQLAEILALIHTRSEGYIHRDIKPSNIICKPDKTLALVDFGAARGIPMPGKPTTIFCSPGYTAPEQIEQRAEARSDFYALGRTFKHLLTGTPPDLLDQDQLSNSSWEKKTSFPKSKLITLINQLCERSVENRPHTAQEIVDRVSQLQQDLERKKPKPVNPRKPVIIIRPKSKRSRHPRFRWRRIAIPIVILAFLGLIVLGVHECTKPRPEGIQIAGINFGNQAFDRSLAEGYAKLRKQGVEAYGIAQNTNEAGDYKKAYEYFDSLRIKANQQLKSGTEQQERENARRALLDFQTLIYRNNALSMQRSLESNSPVYRIVLTAPVGEFEGNEMLIGAALAQNYFVERSQPPVNLMIGIANDNNEKDKAQAVAQQVSQSDPKILAVVGHYTSQVTCSALQTYSDSKVALISPTSNARSVRGQNNQWESFREACKDGNKVFFRTTSTTREEVQGLVRYLQAQPELINKRELRIAAFYSKNEIYSEDLLREFRQALQEVSAGWFVVNDENDEDFDLTKSTFKAEKALKKHQNIDAIALFVDGRSGGDTSTGSAYNVINANNGNRIILGSNPLYAEPTKVYQPNKRALERVVLAVDWDRNCNASQGFINETTNLGGFNRRTAQTYEAVQVLGELFLQARTNNVPSLDTTEIVEKLKSLGSGFRSRVTKGDVSIAFQNGERTGLRGRILVGIKVEEIKNSQGQTEFTSSFEPLDRNQCPILD